MRSVTHKPVLIVLCGIMALSGCAINGNAPGEKLVQLSKAGQCNQADQFANQQFEGSDLYLAKGVVESLCRKNEEKSIEYVTISAKMGNTLAIDALKKQGMSVAPVAAPPAPPVTIKERPPVQPVQVVQQAPSNTINAPRGFVNCTNRGMGVVECNSPKESVRCVDRGMGVVSCN